MTLNKDAAARVQGRHNARAAVRTLVADRNEPFTFFCRGSRSFSKFLDSVDEVFALEIGSDTLNRRLDQRPDDEFGA